VSRAGLSGLVLLLLAPLLLLFSAPPAGAVGTLCLPSKDKACIAGTLRTEKGVLPDVKITITGPDGQPMEATTGDDGRWNVQVAQEGKYTVEIDESSLPDDLNTTGKVTVQAKFGKTAPALIPVRTADYQASESFLNHLLQSGVNGLRLGLLLALASVGLSLIYGTTGLSNFAHAEQVGLGGILGYYLVNLHGLNLWVGGLLVMVLCGFTGWFQDRVMWQPLRRRGLGLTQLMIVTIGLSLAMQYAFQFFVGARTVRVVKDNPSVRSVGPITMTNQSFVAMAIAIVVLAAVGYALLRTRIGRATRAVSDNPALAAASGIAVERIVRIVWTLGAGLAALGGVLLGLYFNATAWNMGAAILLLMFAAVTLGGLGTAFGALAGSIVIGVVSEMSSLVIPSDLRYAGALVILILVLLFRPQGILGRAERIG